jgi:hypothetical protein
LLCAISFVILFFTYDPPFLHTPRERWIYKTVGLVGVLFINAPDILKWFARKNRAVTDDPAKAQPEPPEQKPGV